MKQEEEESKGGDVSLDAEDDSSLSGSDDFEEVPVKKAQKKKTNAISKKEPAKK
jgi:hypothetical protein